MNYLDLTIEAIHQAILDKKVTPLQLVNEALKRANEDTNNAFEYIYNKEAFQFLNDLPNKNINNLLYGIPFVINDNFSTKNIPTCASSNILKGYTPCFSATIYERLIEAGAIPIAKTAIDEIALDNNGTNSHNGIAFNPYDKSCQRIMGGSSFGSASATISSIVPFAIGSDTGASVRKPASYGGLVGLKPTWGRVSRYGLFPFACSLDTVGIFTRSIFDSSLVLSIIAGKDELDATSSNMIVDDYVNLIKTNEYKHLAIIKEIFDSINSKEIKNQFNDVINKMTNKGYRIDVISIDINILRSIFPSYIVISSAEASSNLSYLDGIRFGKLGKGENYKDKVKNTRTNNLSKQVKEQLIFGKYCLKNENYNEIYLKACKARELINNSFKNIFDKYDGILLPSTPNVAPLLKELKNKELNDEYLLADNYMTFANLGGFPSLSLPLGFIDNMPFGINLTCDLFKENVMLSIASDIENITDLKGPNAR